MEKNKKNLIYEFAKQIVAVNPKSGNGLALQEAKKLAEFFKVNNIDSEFICADNMDLNDKFFKKYPFFNKETKSMGEIARLFSSKDEKYLFHIFGGDGTLWRFIQEFNSLSNSRFALYPCGSGNDLPRPLGYNTASEMREALIDGNIEEKMVDAIRINDKYFINIAAFGLPASVLQTSEKLKKLKVIPPKILYYVSLFVTLLAFKSSTVKITIDGEQRPLEKINTFVVANGTDFGGGMGVAYKAELDDGLLDFILAPNMGILKTIKMFKEMQKRKHLEPDSIAKMGVIKLFNQAKHIIVESNRPLPANCDGELLKNNYYEMYPDGQLPLIVPKVYTKQKER